MSIQINCLTCRHRQRNRVALWPYKVLEECGLADNRVVKSWRFEEPEPITPPDWCPLKQHGNAGRRVRGNRER